MNTTAPNPYASRSHRPVSARLFALKARTLGVAGLMLGCALWGLQLLAPPLGALVGRAYGSVLGQLSLPGAHVPAALDTPATLVLFAVLCLVMLVGHSMGLFGGLKARVVILVPLAVAALMVWRAPPAMSWLQVVPSQLERHVLHGRADALEKALTAAKLPAPVLPYVRAQLALRTGDSVALRRHGEQALRLADRFVQGLETDAVVSQFRPGVLLAIDEALHGSAQSTAVRAAQRQGLTLDMLGLALRGAFGLALLAAVFVLLRLWNRMRRRVALIQAEIDRPAPQPFVRAGTGAAAPHHVDDATAAPPSLVDRLRRFSLALAAVPLVYLSVVAIFPRPEEAPQAERDASSGGVLRQAQPCHVIGTWMTSGGNQLTRVTILENGRFVYEPQSGVDVGPDSAMQGHWALLPGGGQMSWDFENGPRRGFREVQAFLEVGQRGFVLMEGSGLRQRYVLVSRPGDGSGCKR